MSRNDQLTAVYLLCYHSYPPQSLADTKGQYRIVEQAIQEAEWPYDNGDDPSFYVARKGGLLTWGVCRQEVRNSIPKGSVAVFFSFTPLPDGQVLYRLCAVTNVVSKVDVRACDHDSRFIRIPRYVHQFIDPA